MLKHLCYRLAAIALHVAAFLSIKMLLNMLLKHHTILKIVWWSDVRRAPRAR
jgi:hypothetical protein